MRRSARRAPVNSGSRALAAEWNRLCPLPGRNSERARYSGLEVEALPRLPRRPSRAGEELLVERSSMLNLLAYQRFVPGLEQVDELRAKLVAECGELRCKFSTALLPFERSRYWKLCDMGQ